MKGMTLRLNSRELPSIALPKKKKHLILIKFSAHMMFPAPIPRLGALDLEPLKQRKKTRTPRSKSQQAKATKPKEVVNLEEEEESTTKDVARVLDSLKEECKKLGRVHYFKFLVDPDSFAHTVENMFHFSFLVKDGRAGVTLGRDGQPYVFIRKFIIIFMVIVLYREATFLCT